MYKWATCNGLTCRVNERKFHYTNTVSSDNVWRWLLRGDLVSNWLRWTQDRRVRRAPVPYSDSRQHWVHLISSSMGPVQAYASSLPTLHPGSLPSPGHVCCWGGMWEHLWMQLRQGNTEPWGNIRSAREKAERGKEKDWGRTEARKTEVKKKKKKRGEITTIVGG